MPQIVMDVIMLGLKLIHVSKRAPRASAAMALAQFSWDIPASSPEGLSLFDLIHQ